MRPTRLALVLLTGPLLFHFNVMAEESNAGEISVTSDREVIEIEKTLSAEIPDALLEKGTASSSTLPPNAWTLGEPDSSPKNSNPVTSEKTVEDNESSQMTNQRSPAYQPTANESDTEEPLESTIRMVRIAPKVEIQKTSDQVRNVNEGRSP